jgi:hypothetical protein
MLGSGQLSAMAIEHARPARMPTLVDDQEQPFLSRDADSPSPTKAIDSTSLSSLPISIVATIQASPAKWHFGQGKTISEY